MILFGMLFVNNNSVNVSKQYKMKRMNQNRLTATLILMIVCLYQVSNVSGQAVKVNIKVNSIVGMQQLMPFEAMPENNMQSIAKVSSVHSRSANVMGAYTLTGKENTNVLIRLDSPEVLVNKENQTMPYQMKLAWQNTNSGDVNAMKWSYSKDNVFKLTRSLNMVKEKTKQDDDSQAYLYLIGYAEIPTNSDSPFEGNVKLTIE